MNVRYYQSFKSVFGVKCHDLHRRNAEAICWISDTAGNALVPTIDPVRSYISHHLMSHLSSGNYSEGGVWEV